MKKQLNALVLGAIAAGVFAAVSADTSFAAPKGPEVNANHVRCFYAVKWVYGTNGGDIAYWHKELVLTCRTN